ncbi:MAG: hypothetical protein COT71_03895 [Candidatus Andersenbacteria bacterium CG10_big_fil_rev_8_21_14_0_10_54_11]|uniref:HTH HARE-type domain-containing protein n=1 Tax=Candidatus Andersenbacteria bacterium CG10_big_fil_rev_8_21_14_0_10_54_11 TaxID=1974485 RepID=A0A2M6WYF5_9BACT|nr:MAG: hypothetical protein COT71_03895 [Candidatus Andersenbacteria bacterium CG10_big_fil_rev_8_21_14_0_10_54_11]
MTPQSPTHDGAIFRESADVLLRQLDARSRDIITRRYGLGTGSIETLDSIGREYGITRERVRQIEAAAKKLLSRRTDVLAPVADTLQLVFTQHGGILAEDYLAVILERTVTPMPSWPLVRFFLDVLPAFTYVSRSAHLKPHWLLEDIASPYAEVVIEAAGAVLRHAGEPMPEEAFIAAVRQTEESTVAGLSPAALYALLAVGNSLKKTVFGEWGLHDWVETTPRGVSDKAYIVLKRHGKPLHFRDITTKINDVHFDHKRAHEQTVHNELIKDERFVLVGRGLYGLTDWGYIPGTVADVLEAILIEARQPLTREELLEKVLKQRMVKKTTVLLGLQNSERFKREADNRYSLRRSA